MEIQTLAVYINLSIIIHSHIVLHLPKRKFQPRKRKCCSKAVNLTQIGKLQSQTPSCCPANYCTNWIYRKPYHQLIQRGHLVEDDDLCHRLLIWEADCGEMFGKSEII